MTTEINSIEEPVERKAVEQRVIAANITWSTYQSFLSDLANQSSIRLTYDRGRLEIMSPSVEHERLNRTIALLIEVVAEELNVNVENLGSTTFQRNDLERGFEPDSCFYIQNAVAINGKTSVDLFIDPPPDLVVEIDITSGSLDKFPIYAEIGVPEIWRYDISKRHSEFLSIYQLSQGNYDRVKTSIAFPLLTNTDITNFIERSRITNRLTWLKELRAWIKEQQKK